ncbi:MAG: alpha/beta hydrolase [Acidobacteriota bacterium]
MNEKSTIVRTIRGIARVLSAVSPPLAARFLGKLFTTPTPHPLRPREKKWLQGVEKSRVRSEELGELQIYSWGEGPTVLLMHGWSGRGAQLGAYAAPLVERGYRVVAMDGVAHGESDGSRATPLLMAASVQAVAGSLGPLAGVIAHSLGTVATTLALTRGIQAERLVYISPPEELSIYIRKAGAFLGFPPTIAPKAQKLLERRYGLSFEAARGAVLGPARLEPLLVIHDREDQEVPYSEGKNLISCWPGAELHTTEGLGHHRILRNAEVVQRAVNFIAQDQGVEQGGSGSGSFAGIERGELLAAGAMS